MVPQGRKHDLEELLAGTRWLRGLAGALVSDPSAADDVAQEAWLVALSRPAAAREPRAWLAGVVKRLAWRQARSTERARRREATVARAEGVPSTEALVERSELQEHLSAAVRALDEPYRTTVLLHYSEGLSLEEIARTQGVPASTMRTRLARALERLRQRLDRTHGDRATWLAALAPLAGAPALPSLTATSISLGTLSMGAKTGFGIAAIAAGIAVLGVTFALREKDRDGLARPGPDVAPQLAASTGIDGPTSQLAETPRIAARQTVQVDPAVAVNQTPLLVFGAVESASGEPVTEASIALWNDEGEQKSATVARDSWSVVGLLPGAWHIRATARSCYPLRDELTLASSSAETRRDLTLQKALALRIRFVDPEGKAVVGTASRTDPILTSLGAVATREHPGLRLLGAETNIPSGGDSGQYLTRRPSGSVEGLPDDCAGLLVLTEPPPVFVSAVLGNLVLESRLVDGTGEEIAFTVDLEGLKSNLSTLTLRLVDAETGAPLEGSVTPRFRNGGVPGVRTGADGVVRVENLVPGLRWLDISARDHQRADRIVRLEPGQMLDLGELRLARERTVKGRVVDEEGRPVTVGFNFLSSDLVRGPLDLERFVGWPGGESFQLPGLGSGEPLLLMRAQDFAVNPLLIETDEQGSLTALARRGTPVLLKHTRQLQRGLHYAIADSAGRPFWLCGVYSEVPIKLRLVPGSYQLLEGQDEVFTLVRTFDVGAHTMVLEP